MQSVRRAKSSSFSHDGTPLPPRVVWRKIPDFSRVVRGFRGKLADLRNLEAKFLKTGIFRAPLHSTASRRGARIWSGFKPQTQDSDCGEIPGKMENVVSESKQRGSKISWRGELDTAESQPTNR
jgi:hypothetical protein